VFGAVMLLALAGFVTHYLSRPHGHWDAWMNWNLRARFLFLGGADWRDGFSSAVASSQPDYPLLVQASVARLWAFGQTEATPTLAGALVAAVFTFSTPFVLLSVFACAGRWGRGLVAGILAIGARLYLDEGVGQCADVPLSFFMLATLAWCVPHSLRSRFEDKPSDVIPAEAGIQEGESTPAPLDSRLRGNDESEIFRAGHAVFPAGIFCALAAWTKNEGMVFALCTAAVLFAFMWKTAGVKQAAKSCGLFAIAALPVALVVVLFKLRIAPVNEIVARQGGEQLLQQFLTPSRYWLTFSAIIKHIAIFGRGLLPLAVGYFFLCRSVRFNPALIVVILTLCCYFMVYIATPLELAWHLNTSLDRLLVQLWPVFLLGLGWDKSVAKADCC